MIDALGVPIYLGAVSLSTACLFALTGMYWQAGLALIPVGLSFYLGVRQLRDPSLSFDEFNEIIKQRLEKERPYTAADFPCPDILPGRGRTVDSHEPVPFAVVTPRSDDSRELLEIGTRLKQWQASHSSVTEIVGLKQLLFGNEPETPTFWFGWPECFPDLFHASMAPVALVFVEAYAADEALGDDLLDQLKDCLCSVQSFSYFAYVGR